MLAKLAYSSFLSWYLAQGTPSVTPLDPLVEKGGVWALLCVLIYWILGVLGKKLDALSASIEKLADKVDKAEAH